MPREGDDPGATTDPGSLDPDGSMPPADGGVTGTTSGGTWSGDDAPAKRAPTPRPAPPGPMDSGRYKSARTLGQGSIGVVKVVHDERLDREVAHKSLKQASTSATARFLREARITASLEHPGVVPVHDIGQEQDGSWFYTMRFVRGMTLEQKLEACTSLTDRLKLLPHFVDLCQAMAYAHHRGVVHRDIKPANVIVGEFGETQVLDWGLAKGKGEQHARDDELAKVGTMQGALTSSGTLVGTVLGTPAYMSPEQAHGRIDEIDARSDVWSLGAILYELLAGDRAFDGADAWEVVAKVRSANVPPVRSAEPAAPKELACVAEKALSLHPHERYQTAAELAADVQAWMTGGRVSAHTYSASEELMRLANRYKAPLAVAAVAAVIITAGTVYSMHHLMVARDAAMASQADAQQKMGELYAVRARDLLDQARWPEAALLAATSLVSRESPDARGALLAATEHPWPRLVRGFEATCTDAEIAGTRVICGSRTGLFEGDLATGASQIVDVRPLSQVEVASDGQVLATGRRTVVVRIESPDGTARDVSLPQALPGDVFALAPDGTLLAASVDQALVGRVPQLAEVAVGGTLAAWRGSAWALAQRGPGVLTVGLDGTVGRVAGTEAFTARALSWTEGDRLALGTSDGEVLIVDTITGQLVRRFEAHRGVVEAMTATGSLLVSSGEDGVIAVHDTTGGLRVRLAGSPTTGVHADPATPDRVVTYDAMDPALRVWDLAEVARETPMRARTHLASVSWRPDGTLDLCETGGRIAHLAADGAVLAEVDAGLQIVACATSPDGKRVAAVGPAQFLVLDEAYAPVAMGEAHDASTLKWSDDSRVVYVAERGQLAITAFDLFTGERRTVVDSVEPRALAVRGQRIGFTDDEGRARVIDLTTGSTVARLATGDARTLTFVSDDTALLATGDGTLTRWDLAADKASPHAFGARRPHQAEIASVAVSPDGTLVATASFDRTARLWDAATGEVVAILPGHAHRVSSVAFSPDGGALLTTSWDDTARRWTLAGLKADPAAVIADVEQRAGLTMVDGAVHTVQFER